MASAIIAHRHSAPLTPVTPLTQLAPLIWRDLLQPRQPDRPHGLDAGGGAAQTKIL